MLLGDMVQEIFVDLRRRKLRTLLTVAGIGIGSFTIGIMVALGIGLHNYIVVQARSLRSPRALRVVNTQADFTGFLTNRLLSIGRPARQIKKGDRDIQKLFGGRKPFKPEEIEKLRALKGVASVSPGIWVHADSIRLEGDPREFFVNIMVRSPIDGFDLAHGRLFDINSEDEVVLAYQYLESFGLENPEDLVGKKVFIQVPLSSVFARLGLMDPEAIKERAYATYDATVVGITQKTIVSTAAFVSERLGMTMARFQRQNEKLYQGEKWGQMAIVRVQSEADIEPVKAKITEFGFFSWSLDDDFATLANIFLIIDTFLSSFGIIALGVACLGIINTLIMSIYERTREIGIMKALGATPGNIRLIFTLEAATIGLLGGILGCLASQLVGHLMNRIALETFARDWGGYEAFVFPWWLLLGTVLFSAVVAALAGLYPAGKAAKLDPIRALRYE
jgi:putative ABC transport system permease protein